MPATQIVGVRALQPRAGTIGTGPFRFAEWKTGEHIRVVRNPDYWRGPGVPRIDEIVWAFIPDSNTRSTRFGAAVTTGAAWSRRRCRWSGSLPGHDVHLVDMNSVMHLDLSPDRPRPASFSTT